jgi:hypothetical protein
MGVRIVRNWGISRSTPGLTADQASFGESLPGLL